VVLNGDATRLRRGERRARRQTDGRGRGRRGAELFTLRYTSAELLTTCQLIDNGACGILNALWAREGGVRDSGTRHHPQLTANEE